jgi:ABC-2 type transport system ATP-binding protein
MIRVEGVTRRLGSALAVDRASFSIGAGAIAGLLGPNGAGKSTLLRLLATYLAPDAGTIEICGRDAAREPLEVRRSIGYLPEHNPLFESMRVADFLDFLGKVRGVPADSLRSRRDALVERCGLAEVALRRVRECSKGFRQRIGLAGALIHDPPVLLLDEPTHGLDPLQVAGFRELVEELREGRAIVFSSHVLAEVAAISTRILAMHAGRIVLDASTAEIAKSAGGKARRPEDVVLDAVKAAIASTGAARATEAAR